MILMKLNIQNVLNVEIPMMLVTLVDRFGGVLIANMLLMKKEIVGLWIVQHVKMMIQKTRLKVILISLNIQFVKSVVILMM